MYYIYIYKCILLLLLVSRLVDIVPATSSPEQHPLGKSKSGRLGVPSSFTENPIWFFLQMGGPLNHPFFGGIFPCKPSSYWGTPMTMETPICRGIFLNQQLHDMFQKRLLGSTAGKLGSSWDWSDWSDWVSLSYACLPERIQLFSHQMPWQIVA